MSGQAEKSGILLAQTSSGESNCRMYSCTRCAKCRIAWSHEIFAGRASTSGSRKHGNTKSQDRRLMDSGTKPWFVSAPWPPYLRIERAKRIVRWIEPHQMRTIWQYVRPNPPSGLLRVALAAACSLRAIRYSGRERRTRVKPANSISGRALGYLPPCNRVDKHQIERYAALKSAGSNWAEAEAPWRDPQALSLP